MEVKAAGSANVMAGQSCRAQDLVCGRSALVL